MKWIVDTVAETAPKGFFHPCPWYGLVKAHNISFSTKGFITQFSRGRYKIFLRFFDKFDDNIISLHIGTDVTAKLKN